MGDRVACGMKPSPLRSDSLPLLHIIVEFRKPFDCFGGRVEHHAIFAICERLLGSRKAV
jgi:hypothetical protein